MNRWCNLVSEQIEAFSDDCSNSLTYAEVHKEWAEGIMPEGADMLMPTSQVAFLSMLVAITGAKRVFEIGTFIGYCTMYLLRNLPKDGVLYTAEMNHTFAREAVNYLPDPRIFMFEGRGQDYLKFLSNLDLVVVDGEKIEYDECYEVALPAMRAGGVIVFDNTLWRGSVMSPNDEISQALYLLNRKLLDDKRVEVVLLPAWDGLTLARKL